jgi:hypothetical protein
LFFFGGISLDRLPTCSRFLFILLLLLLLLPPLQLLPPPLLPPLLLPPLLLLPLLLPPLLLLLPSPLLLLPQGGAVQTAREESWQPIERECKNVTFQREVQRSVGRGLFRSKLFLELKRGSLWLEPSAAS